MQVVPLARLRTACRVFLLQAGGFCTAKSGTAGTRVSQPEAGVTNQPSLVTKMVGSLGVGKSRKLTGQIPCIFNNKLYWGTWGWVIAFPSACSYTFVPLDIPLLHGRAALKNSVC